MNRLYLSAGSLIGVPFAIFNYPQSDWSGYDCQTCDWDELVQGVENRHGWLGEPLGETVHLERSQPDLLEGKGIHMTTEFLDRVEVPENTNVNLSATGRVMTVASSNNGRILFRIKQLESLSGELTLFTTLSVDNLDGALPKVLGRSGFVRLLKDSGEVLQKIEIAVSHEPFDNILYFREVSLGSLTVEFEFDGIGRVFVRDSTAHAHADIVYREFANGLMLANPSLDGYTFDLTTLLPGGRFKRLQGSPGQDTATNNGQNVGASFRLSGKNAILFERR